MRLKLFQVLAISLIFTSCTSKPIYITVGLTKETIYSIYKNRPVQFEFKTFETNEVIRVTIHRDDKRGK